MDIMTRMWIEGWTAEERSRLERYAKAWDAYFGKADPTLKSKPGQPDDNVQANFARLIVDIGVAFLFGQEPMFELGDGKERTPQEQWLDDAWRANRKMQLLQKMAMNGAVCGHVFAKITSPTMGSPYPRIINISPEYVRVDCDPDDIDIVWRYLIAYEAKDKNANRVAVRQRFERTDVARWEIIEEESVNDGQWRTRQAIVWPYAWSPIVDCQNRPSPNEYYGIADLEPDTLQLGRAINFTLSNLQRIIRYHAHPKTWGKGFTANELKIAVDETIVLPSPDASLQNLEMLSDLSSSIDYYLRLKEILHETTGVPEVATGKLENTGQLSGTALGILYQPIVQRTEQKRLTYGEMLIELNRRLLDMVGYGDNNITNIVWGEVLPKNRLEELQAAMLEKQVGVSQDTLLTKLGYDPDAERDKREVDSNDTADQLLAAFDRGDTDGDSRRV